MAAEFDLIVIGSGPGGYVAAIRATQLGLKVAIVERDLLGGICLNWGCIPTKALLKSGEKFESLSHLKEFGLSAENVSFDFDAIIARSRGVAKQLNAGVGYLMKKNKIEVIEGTARLEKGGAAPKVVIALKAGGSRTVEARTVMLAVGARARALPQIGLEASASGPIAKPWPPNACPNRSSSSARGRSALSSAASTAPSASRSPWSRPCRASSL
jgi:dihydrolipoamide dehydrogenase